MCNNEGVGKKYKIQKNLRKSNKRKRIKKSENERKKKKEEGKV